MKRLGLVLLGLTCTASIGFASTVRSPVALPSKSCCETCTVARFIPPLVPAVPASMITAALLMEAGLLIAGVLGFVGVRRLRPGAILEPGRGGHSKPVEI